MVSGQQGVHCSGLLPSQCGPDDDFFDTAIVVVHCRVLDGDVVELTSSIRNQPNRRHLFSPWGQDTPTQTRRDSRSS